ncbi:UNVERIFIED_CONTAM: hypothetical protein K2H54_001067 [Gekko kuhli]
MRKKSYKKASGRVADKAEVTPKSVKAFFPVRDPLLSSDDGLSESPKMAAEHPGTDLLPSQPTTPLTKNDLSELKEDLLNSMSTLVTKLIQPLQLSIDDLRKDLKETSTLAENASELALTLQEEDEQV